MREALDEMLPRYVSPCSCPPPPAPARMIGFGRMGGRGKRGAAGIITGSPMYTSPSSGGRPS